MPLHNERLIKQKFFSLIPLLLLLIFLLEIIRNIGPDYGKQKINREESMKGFEKQDCTQKILFLKIALNITKFNGLILFGSLFVFVHTLESSKKL